MKYGNIPCFVEEVTNLVLEALDEGHCTPEAYKMLVESYAEQAFFLHQEKPYDAFVYAYAAILFAKFAQYAKKH